MRSRARAEPELPGAMVRAEGAGCARRKYAALLDVAGVACLAHFDHPVAAMVLGGLFALSFVVGFGLRRREPSAKLRLDLGQSMPSTMRKSRSTPSERATSASW
ncbi:hypothetical protein GCM10023335_67270 [Streptomyces siamensis]|uniref:Uncharacterized protein n=1 Tax=Streptomyces siamensis TaxID=1274986 RepID=A0ABP9JE86_9ACTN